MVAWLVLLTDGVKLWRQGNFGFSDFMLGGILGIVAYLLTLGLGGFGALEARRELRANPQLRAIATRALLWLTMMLLITPWIALVLMHSLRAQ